MTDWTPRRIATAAASFLFGIVGTAVVGLGMLIVLNPIQVVLYDLVYLTLGPSGATEFATVGLFVYAGAIAIVTTTLIAEYVSVRDENAHALLPVIAAMGVLVVLFLGSVLAGVIALGAGLAWVAVTAVTVPGLLWFRYDVRSDGVLAFLGGVPVLVLMLFVAGVGIGWGWGYVVTAQEIPNATVGDGSVATFEDVPAVSDELFADSNCEVDAAGDRRCRLVLRGSEHELTTARFLADHGVRCPYVGSGRDSGSFDARHEDAYYRVSCAGYGD